MTNEPPNNKNNQLPRPRRREFPAPLTRQVSGGAASSPDVETVVLPAADAPIEAASADGGAAPSTRSALPTPKQGTTPSTAATTVRATRRAPVVAPPPPVPEEPALEDDFDEYDDDYEEYEPQRETLLHNPYVLAALAVSAAIVLAIIVVLIAGRNSGDGSNVGAIATQDPRTPVAPSVGVDSISTSTVRSGPGTDYDSIGTLPRGQKVSVTGRDTDSKWFQIIFPQNSTLRGWVPASALKVSDLNVQAIGVVVSTPITRPTVVVPTVAVQPTQAATAEATATEAATDGGPDIAVGFLNNNCTAGAPASILIRNVGSVAVTGRTISASVAVGGVVTDTQSFSIGELAPGNAVTLPMDEVITAPRTSIAADLTGSPADPNKGNNVAECAVQGAAATPSPVATTPAVSTPAATNTPNIAIGTPVTPASP